MGQHRIERVAAQISDVNPFSFAEKSDTGAILEPPLCCWMNEGMTCGLPPFV